MRARSATTDDVEEMTRLAAIMFAEVGADPSAARWRDHVPRVLADGLDAGRIGAFVVDDPERADRRLLSTGAAIIEQRLPTPDSPDGRIAYVQWVCTEPSARRRGLARVVMSALVDWTRDRGVARLELHASDNGERLYEALDFRLAAPSYRLPLAQS